MRIKYGLIGLILSLSAPVYSLEARELPELAPMERQAQAAHLSAQFLGRYAYKPVKLDDALSAKIMNQFIKSLDPDRMLFAQADIDGFMKNSTKIDDAILDEDLTIPFSMFSVYSERVVQRMTHAQELLKQDFDFGAQEEFSIMREDAPWATSEDESRELWRKRVKSDWLRLKLAGQSDDAIRKTLGKRYQNILDRVYTYKGDDVFQTFMAAYTTSVDPHTDYFGAKASEEFDISMRLSLVGIGAVLQDRDGYTTIRELVAGGPAQLSGKIAVGDRIIGVGQGEDGAIEEVVGTRLDEVVQLIRGKEDSVVRLDILPAEAGESGSHRVISLVREKISLEKQAASKAIIPVEENGTTRKIGVITLPAFYEDFDARQKGDKDYRGASRDVAKLLGELKQEKVDGVLIDLRDNGGGSLTEAIEMTGLFVGKGPVVQQRNAQGEIRIESDDLPKPEWAGPLGVLINRGSASASEIFAAAIQDYGRGVIIGDPSFGKGSVQTVVNLDRMVKNAEANLGEIKLTIAQFFRIDGGTTQLRGVTPDIGLPGLADPKTFGEASYENALPWTEIKPAKHKDFADLTALIPQLQERHETRAKTDADFKRFVEDANELKAQREKNTISLNEAERRKEMDAMTARLKARQEAGGSAPQDDDGLQSNERSLTADLAIENARKNAKDVLKNEAAAIVADHADLLAGPGKRP
ncbi:tail-specific protease [Rhizobiales bacterium RZME27]|uniref:Tail-specific protease n=1 Tax=Endobacterium cereale TaxID=2663029 RepID=A0A6A8AKJ9_9HYPH|nr:carboxy terminal-processing peptidase [Endobacterium cereale]MEB2847412.1 carboxy terminal-processing peptidase [Endobacterium cereale]MQY49261.1 tail-specific protease [Endobacterium cereale]